MVSAEIIGILSRRVPNYHIVSPKFAKGSFSVCPCGACQHSLTGRTPKGAKQYMCGRVYGDFVKMDCVGNAVVSAYGTCDAAKFSPVNYELFRLEGEKVEGSCSLKMESTRRLPHETGGQ